jgi:regulator of replication initiation timing
MTDRIEERIDEIIATCDGDLRGALKALLLVNEHLEFELQQLQARGALDEKAERRTSSLH